MDVQVDTEVIQNIVGEIQAIIGASLENLEELNAQVNDSQKKVEALRLCDGAIVSDNTEEQKNDEKEDGSSNTVKTVKVVGNTFVHSTIKKYILELQSQLNDLKRNDTRLKGMAEAIAELDELKKSVDKSLKNLEDLDLSYLTSTIESWVVALHTYAQTQTGQEVEENFKNTDELYRGMESINSNIQTLKESDFNYTLEDTIVE